LDDLPANDDAPLFVPEEFQLEHLEEAHRTVAKTSGRQHVGRRIVSVVHSGKGTSRHWSFALAVIVHAVAALLLLAITAVTDTWAAGGIVLGLVALSLAVTLALLRSVERRR
jgi:hypothetical protein